MLDSVKLNLSRSRRSPARDVWRAVSDLFGGTLALVVWLALWTWIAIGVVGPLSRVVEPGPRVAVPSQT
jgi:hypothetical protein